MKKNKLTFFDSGISRHVLMWFLLFALVPLTVISTISYYNARELLNDYARNELTDIAILHTNNIQNRFEAILQDLTLESQLKTNIAFMQELITAFSESKLPLKQFTQSFDWAMLADKHAGDLQKFWEVHGYHDIILIDRQGNILYSIAREADLGTNLFTGDYANTHFARAAKKSLKSGKDFISDLEFYTPSSGTLSSFVISPLLDKHADKIGLLAFQLSENDLDKLVENKTHFGETGKRYIIGEDLKLRSRGIFGDDFPILKKPIVNEQTAYWQATPNQNKNNVDSSATEKRILVYKDPVGAEVMGILTDIKLPGINWAFITEIEVDEILSHSRALSNWMIVLIMLTALIVILIAIPVTRNLASPIMALSQSLLNVRKGDLDQQIDIDTKHELQTLVQGFNETVATLKNSQEKLMDANHYKSEFLANMSHEIRTPMNAVIGMTHLALKTKLDKQQRNYLEKVHLSAVNLLGILNDILDFSKIESGKLEMESIDFRLEDVIQNVNNIISVKCEEKNIKLNYEFEPDIPTALVGDPLRLGQVLLNLGNNAVKFTPIGGTITAGVKLQSKENQDVILHFWIRDTGIGMTEEEQQRLFSSFNQADSSVTRKFGGTGLGLAISQTLAHMMKGDIRVESQVDIGSTFHFMARLKLQQGMPSPRLSPMIEEKKNLKESIAKLKGSKILLVEDNPVNQELALELLTTNGLTVETANNGRDALVLLSSEDFDGVLMDCQMPVMDGYTATRRLREQEKYKHLPIIALTANTMKGDREKVLACGMNDHIGKPIDVEHMFSTMAEWITPTRLTADTHEAEINTSPAPADEFSSLPGVDAEKGLSITQGNTTLYKRLLIKFHDTQGNFAVKFSAARSSQDKNTYIRLAHSLKGVSGNVGITGIYESALELEKACREDKENIDNLFEQLVPELNQVLAGIDTLKEQTSAESKEPAKELADVFREVQSRLKQGNISTAESLQSLRNQVDETEHSTQLNTITQLVDDFDFSAAADELESLAEKMGVKLT